MITRPIPAGAVRIPLPDTRQQTGYTCGAASLRAVCEYFGVGPRTEQGYVADMRMPRAGADPEHFTRALAHYGLEFKTFHRMGLRQLKRAIDRKRPVIMMLQAWPTPGKIRRATDYRADWDDGHWVVAIGYDERVVYFEDPSIARARGYMSYRELELRWHDVGPHYGHMNRYGISVWRNGQAAAGRHGRRTRGPPAPSS